MNTSKFDREQLESVIQGIPAGVLVLTPDGLIRMASSRVSELLDVSDADTLVGQMFYEFLPPMEQDALKACLRKVAGSQIICALGPGANHRLHLRLTSGVLGSERVVYVVICEAEPNRPVQAELRHAQKLEVVGQLAGGIAHDFNNLITAIFGYLDIARRMLPPDHQAQAAIDGVREAAEQAAGVTRTLLTFTRKSTPERTKVELKGLVQQSVRLLRKAMPSSIQLVAPPETSGDSVWMEADANQIQQVILNLALNARDALTRGGTIRLGAEYATEGGDGKRAVLTVSDTGGGIPPEVLPRIFEPFFTTKADSGHSGLGLAIIQEIIKNHGGKIDLKTTVGEGTTFRVSFPAAEADGTARSEPVDPSLPVHGETLLIVEDELQVRQIIASQLRQIGYQVIEAGNSASAAAMLETHKAEVAMVICDLELPDLPGDKLVSKLRAAGSQVPVILITGSIQFDPGPLEQDGVTLLRKPFGVARLADTVSKVLSSGVGGRPAHHGEQKA